MAGSPLLTVLSVEAGCLSAPVVFEPTVRQQVDQLTNDVAIVDALEGLAWALGHGAQRGAA
jgi:hypothetical protein